MNYFSTFSGIGGFELGINQAYEVSDRHQLLEPNEDILENSTNSKGLWERRKQNAVCIGYSEIDRYAIATYEHHFPDHKNYGDITAIDADKLPDFDLLVGGFPCQAFSVAGKRRGFLDETRGTLFFDLARILRAKRPKYFVFENVKGLLSHDGGRTFDTIITTLNELWYDLQWQVLNSKDWGVPQNRERVFIVGHLRDEPRPEVFPLGTSYTKSKEISEPNDPRHSNAREYEEQGVITSTITTENAHGFGKNVTANQVYDIASLTGNIRRLTPTECERLQGFPDAWTLGSDTQRYKQCGNAVTVNVVQAVMQRLFDQPND